MDWWVKCRQKLKGRRSATVDLRRFTEHLSRLEEVIDSFYEEASYYEEVTGRPEQALSRQRMTGLLGRAKDLLGKIQQDVGG